MQLKLFIIAVIIFVFAIIFAIFVYLGTKVSSTGYVYDCQTNQPLSGVNLQSQQTGMLFPFTWDITKISETTTDDNGFFNIKFYPARSASLYFSKDGYFKHNAWIRPRTQDSKFYLVKDNVIPYKGTLRPITMPDDGTYSEDHLFKKVPGCGYNNYLEF